MKIKVRKTRLEDCRRVAHVHRASIRKICSSCYDQDVIDIWASGSTANGVRRSLNNRIWLVYVHPKWVGLDIGKKLIQRLESDMLKKGFKDIKLESSLNAYNFYLRNGYKKVKKKSLEFRNGLKIPCIEMKKALS